ncbi:hypothetical protein FNW02_18260 [Komarekiella sp. 'clone 1']|uniref:Uncharacterized protein n=1 Tax=Komarekiella delphini-convector SJRDD-AB1 TaxID=2593771 RepID=A0AA40SYR2_9NOST|nr:hypothetical protein [Komarekiella delphini-convector]MBD6617721.1 hypothetical protein [Komarekiella delphini-convector SJRDD-AB1]
MASQSEDSTTELNRLREVRKALNSIKIQEALRTEPDQNKKRAFETVRDKIDHRINQLEGDVLTEFLIKLQQNESSFKKGIKNLEEKITNFEDVARLTEEVNEFLGIIIPWIPFL